MHRIESIIVVGAFAVSLLATCAAAGIAVQQRNEAQALRAQLKACAPAAMPAPAKSNRGIKA